MRVCRAMAGLVITSTMTVPGLAACASAMDDFPETREWAVMIYMGADSGLCENEDGLIAEFTLKLLRKALIDPHKTTAVELGEMDVHLVVMVDTLGTSGTYVYDAETLAQDPTNLHSDYLPEIEPVQHGCGPGQASDRTITDSSPSSNIEGGTLHPNPFQTLYLSEFARACGRAPP